MSKYNIKTKINLAIAFLAVLSFFSVNISAAQGTGNMEMSDIIENSQKGIKVVELLQKVNDSVSENKLDEAEDVTEEILAIDPDNLEAKKLMEAIRVKKQEIDKEDKNNDREPFFNRIFGKFGSKEEKDTVDVEDKTVSDKEAARQAARERSAAEKARKQAERKAAREKAAEERVAKKAAEEARIEKKVNKYLEKSKKYDEKDKHVKAMEYLDKAEKLDKDNEEIDLMKQSVEKNVMYLSKETQEEEIKLEVSKNKMIDAEKVIEERKEPLMWYERLTSVMKEKYVDLGNVHPSKIYSIDDCLQVALARSPRLRIAKKQIKLSEIRLWEARRNLMPSLSLKMERSSGRISADNLMRHYEGEKYQVEVKQTLFDGMNLWFELKQSQANLESVLLDYQRIKDEIINEVKKSYYSLDKSHKALEIQQELKARITKYFDIYAGVYEEGLISKVEYLKLQGQKMQAEFQVLSANEDISLAEMILFQNMGLISDEKINIKPVEKPTTFLEIDLQECYDLAMANQPSYRIKVKGVEYYDYERKMNKARAWPKVDFNGSIGIAFENYNPLTIGSDYTTSTAGGAARSGRDHEPEWYAGVKTSIPLWGNTLEHNYVKETWAPTVSAFRGSESWTNYLTLKIFDDLAYFSDLEEARVGYERASYDLVKAKNDLMINVKETYFKYVKSMLQLDMAKVQLDQQQTLVNVMEERMRYGEMETSRVAEEVVKLSEYKYAVIQSVSDYYTALANLNMVIGIPNLFLSDYEREEYTAWKNSRSGEKEQE